MQKIIVLTLLALGAASDVSVQAKGADRTITKVVKLLQGMLDVSHTEAKTEASLFAKFKCYCDSSLAARSKSMKEGGKDIEMHQAKIELLQGSSGELSESSAKLSKGISDNADDISESDRIAGDELSAFNTAKGDFEQAIGQMNQAVKTLSAVGADQTQLNLNQQAMRGYKGASLLSTGTQSEMEATMKSASAYMNEKQYESFNSFMQAPFTGTYSSQSAGVMGIIKEMRDTYKTNLEEAKANEAARLKAYNARDAVLKEAKSTMTGLYNKAQAKIGANDGVLATTRGLLKTANKDYADDDKFLNEASVGLVDTCKTKSLDYDDRKAARANEDAAVAQAISILNSDEAFATFGDSTATKTGATSFLQISRHDPMSDDVRITMERLLHRAAAKAKQAPSPRVQHVMALVKTVKADNAFDTLIGEIDKMISVVDKESDADDTKYDFCKEERKVKNKEVGDAGTDLNTLDGAISTNKDTISGAETGLNDVIAKTEGELAQNNLDMTTVTKERKEDNVAYQQNIKNLGASKRLLKNAIRVLKSYYDKIDKAFLQSYGDAAALLQKSHKVPGTQSALLENDAWLSSHKEAQAPATWENDSYSGQKNKAGGGNEAITMLQFIETQTLTEETAAHQAEQEAQHAYEDAMTGLKTAEAAKMKSVAGLRASLASESKDLLENQMSRKETAAQKAATEDYLAKIKPGCDFITNNIAARRTNRVTEKKALQDGKTLLKNSPQYKALEAERLAVTYGKCRETCVADAAHVDCKSCMADTTVVGYCAGHKGTPGCAE